MLMRTDPFRELDRLTEALLTGSSRPGTLPLDAYRDGHEFVVELEVPGVDASEIDLTIERNVLTVHAERKPAHGSAERVVGERAYGTFSRQLFLGETLDTERLSADYANGVLTVRIPVAEQAKPRRIEASASENGRTQIES